MNPIDRWKIRLSILTTTVLLFAAAKGGDAPAPNKQSVDVIALTVQAPEVEGADADARLLNRELARQALLIAARDELSIATRDEALREPLANAGLSLALKSEVIKDDYWTITIFRTDTNAEVWKKKTALKPEVGAGFEQIIEIATALMQTEFVALLKGQGVDGKPHSKRDAASIPDDIEKHLEKMDYADQFSAVRSLHTEIRSNGESIELIAGLVRGYSNLAQMTRHHWCSSRQVFTARALLYSQYLVSKHPVSPAAIRSRAYARAFSGCHGAALSDLELARKADRAGAVEPDSSKLLDLFCHFDGNALVAHTELADPEMRLFLRYLVSYESEHYYPPNAKAFEAMSHANPECYCVYDGLAETESLAALNISTITGPETLAQTLYVRLQGMPGLPASLRGLLDSTSTEADTNRREKVLNRFVDEAARDRGEPSWAVLGRALQEMTFIQAASRAEFMLTVLGAHWGNRKNEFLASQPLNASHPYHNLLEYYIDARPELMKDVVIDDANFAERTMIVMASYYSGHATADQGRVLVESHTDDLTDLMRLGRSSTNTANDLLRRSPFHPLAHSELIRLDWDSVKDKAAEWEREFSQHTAVLLALAEKYEKDGALDNAKRCLLKYVKISPDYRGYEPLARIYRNQGDLAKWRETLDTFINTGTDGGLERSIAQMAIVDQLMSENKFAEAVPYADSAAATWSQKSMECARDCNIATGNLNAAEQWQSKLSERYIELRLQWYSFCQRTGIGDVDKAAKIAMEYANAARANANSGQLIDIAGFFIIHGDIDLAYSIMKSEFEKYHNPYFGIHMALIEDSRNNPTVRDQLLQQVVEKGAENVILEDGKPRTHMIQTAKAFSEALSKGGAMKMHLTALDKTIADADLGEQANINYFVGRFLELHGTKEAAIEYFKRSVKTGRVIKNNFVLSAVQLRAYGIEINGSKSAKQDKLDF